MQSVFDILDILYTTINVSSVTDLIDGEVQRWKPGLNSKLQDVVIRVLTNSDSEEDIQPSIVIINIYCKKFANGLYDETKLKEINDAVITVLKAYTKTSGTYFSFVIVDQTIFDDPDELDMSYLSIRLNISIQT